MGCWACRLCVLIWDKILQTEPGKHLDMSIFCDIRVIGVCFSAKIRFEKWLDRRTYKSLFRPNHWLDKRKPAPNSTNWGSTPVWRMKAAVLSNIFGEVFFRWILYFIVRNILVNFFVSNYRTNLDNFAPNVRLAIIRWSRCCIY